MKLLHVVGARPNYMKVASVMRAAARDGRFRQVLVHTGQHYDAAMNDVFFADLGLPAPDHYLGVGSGSQTGHTPPRILAFDPLPTPKNNQPYPRLTSPHVDSTTPPT